MRVCKIGKPKLKMTRILFWFAGVCISSALIILFSGTLLSNPQDCSQSNGIANIDSMQDELRTLRQQVLNLQSQLNEARHLASIASVQSLPELSMYKTRALFYENFFKNRIDLGEIVKGVPYNNEYEQPPFVMFTSTRVYVVDPGLGKRVIEKPIALKKRELLEVINQGALLLNKKNEKDAMQFTSDDFVEGIHRTLPTHGSHYELFYKRQKSPAVLHKVIIARPFGPLYDLLVETKNLSNVPINIIVPLSGRVDVFAMFMSRLIKVCSSQLSLLSLTIVYHTDNSTTRVDEILNKARNAGFKDVKFILRTGPFSRGQALQAGVMAWEKSEDILMFFCDVDVWFTLEYLQRCRTHALAGHRVYYPIVFSLFNPHVVYSLEDVAIPRLEDQLVISKNTGFWRDFGYGMTCQYRSDFLSIRGFDENISGWGLEDVYLYKKYVRSQLFVVRATDPSIFHLWHEKTCNASLPEDQYKGCIRSKALNEASHAQLGMLAFKEEIAIYRNSSQSRKL